MSPNDKMNPTDSALLAAKISDQKLRAIAEHLIDVRPREDAPSACSAEELVHELRVHQIELKMQNEALRQAQQALEESRDRYVDLYEFAPVGYLTLSASGMIAEINLTAVTLLGLERDKLLHKSLRTLVVDADQDRWVRHFMDVIKHTEKRSIEMSIQRGNGAAFLAQLACVSNAATVLITLTDITRVKQEHRDLQRRSWALRALSNCNKALVISRTESAMLQGVCEAVVADSDLYLLAWVGWAEHDEKKSVRIAASAGGAVGYLENIQVSWADETIGSGPTGMAIRNGRTVINKDPKHNPKFTPWLEKALSLGIRASIAVPILVEGKVVGSLMVYANDEEAFDAEEVKLFEDLTKNLGHGLAALAIQRKFDRSLIEKEMQAQKLDAALEGALLAVASTLEQRDPYTAGHQKNVAELAVKIGSEMGMSSEQLRALHLAGIVHDLGKIQIPAEILTKSGRLTPAEFSLIKIHPEVGYEILRHITFPWPIADIIHQHHEYLDGSGYPKGLKEDQILPEAKVLTVADIVESMSSDRPYRAALGLETAMNEISKLSGSKLDPVVVSACITVLKREELPPFLKQQVIA